jgi:signal peptidase II
MKKINIYASFFLGFALFLADQISKAVMLKTKADLEFISFFCNENIAWGIRIPPSFFYVLWIIIIGLLFFQLKKNKTFYARLPLILILSGGISNLIDRLIHGCVIDFIDLKFWPVFNLADIFIAIGVAMLLLKILKNKSRAAGHHNF